MLVTLDGEGLLQDQVYRALKLGVLNGRLKAGQRLSGSRKMAAELLVSRNTVNHALERLRAEGYVLARAGSSFFVAPSIHVQEGARKGKARNATRDIQHHLSSYGARVTALSPEIESGLHTRPPGVDFQYGAVDPDPRLRREFGRVLRQAIYEAESAYAEAAGLEGLREAVSAYLMRRRGFAADPRDIVIVAGAQQGLDLTARILLNEGDLVLIEAAHYQGSRQIFQSLGAQLQPVALDGDGLVVADAEAAIGARCKLIAVTPSHQFPTGAVLSLPRRLALLRLARERDLHILEDDYDSEFSYQSRPIEALRTLDHEGRVIYLGTFAKMLSPALRLGYLVLPPPLSRVVRTAKWLADRGVSVALQMALANFIRSGAYERHVRRMARIYDRRRVQLLAALRYSFGEEISVQGAESGVHVTVWFKERAPTFIPRLIHAAASLGVTVYPVAPYYLTAPKRAGIMMGYSTVPDRLIAGAVKRLHRAFVNVCKAEQVR
jgi:GntR family transcriptional regulator/MocR family aminotransferase